MLVSKKPKVSKMDELEAELLLVKKHVSDLTVLLGKERKTPKIKDVITGVLDEYVLDRKIEAGVFSVSLDLIYEDAKLFSPHLEFSKSRLGRHLSKNFKKRQVLGKNKIYVTCYYINKKSF